MRRGIRGWEETTDEQSLLNITHVYRLPSHSNGILTDDVTSG